ncbi:Osmotin, thaumatin-like protein (Fragment) [Madurella fahalii]|uniref:Osmotin, thaumatin-like protein n=1 Tax=Madurella fahalii TaxID=1157608 RepID=A0ABQ0GFF0_9PEZI
MAHTNQRRIVLGPLTTTFTPPAPCSVAVGLCETCDVAWWGQTCAPRTVQDDPSCWPAPTVGAVSPEQMLLGWGFYSPGVICPAGYTSACTAVAGQTTGWKHQFVMEPEETFIGCCPTGFKCDNLRGQTCISGVRSTELPTLSCDAGSTVNFGFTTLPNPSANVSVLNLFAPMIQLAWKESDLSSLTTSTSSATSSSGTPSNSSPTTSAATATQDAQTGSRDASNDLSIGAIAGIAVGAAVLFLAIVAAAVYVWRRRRSQMGGSALSDGSSRSTAPPGYTAVSPIDSQKQFQHYYSGAPQPWGGMSELNATMQVYEAPGPGYGPTEMPAYGTDRAEMPTLRYN